MNNLSRPFPVSDTAALVMLWAAEYYGNKPLIGTYLRNLDLSSGKLLLERYNTICSWYPEVIINRKHFIKTMVEELTESSGKRTVIANIGAGFSPLALEILPLLGDQVRFIEIDMQNMGCKRQLYSTLIPDKCSFISCRESNIEDTGSLTRMFADTLGKPEQCRLIVVMEGLSYYIGKPEMRQVLKILSDLAPDLAVVFEHLKPCHLISDDRRYIPQSIFSHVRDYTGLPRMTTYSDDEIQEMLGPSFSFFYANMDEMEKKRTGCGNYFPAPESGWLSCSVAIRRQ